MKAARGRDLVLGLLVAAVVAGALFVLGVRHTRRPARPRREAPDLVDPNGIDAAGRTPAENRAIADGLVTALKDLPPLRVAEDADSDDSDSRSDLRSLYGDYHPYFVRGDLDGDGHLDFAQAFVEKRPGGPWFHVAVFFGRGDGTYQKPIWVEKAISLTSGDLSIDRSLLIVTPDVSMDDARRWRFEPEGRRFVDADAASSTDDPDDDTPDETPDGRPQVRT